VIPSPAPLHALLRCHPATPPGVALALSVEVHLAGDALRLRYVLRGEVAALRIPEPATPGPADGLWQHTCFEAFVAVEGEAAYGEFNFSPSGQWAAYRFAAERERDAAGESRHPVSLEAPHTVRAPDTLALTAHVPLAAPARGLSALCIGLSAVIEEGNGHLSYWALHHPKERPDFHHRDGRALRLAAPSN
jgi:hypothetical protein